MKILYLTHPKEDYLQDNLLCGLRQVLGADLVDYPRKSAVYKDDPRPSSMLYGCGFTAWKVLDEIAVDRDDIDRKVTKKYFDLIVFGSIRRQKPVALEYLKSGRFFLPGNRFAFVDGDDSVRIAWKLLPFGTYFKRERAASLRLFTRRINFAIPASKCRTVPLEKSRLFAKHVQCDEAYKLDYIRENCMKRYAFSDEKEYYDNLASSKYAVTMKKAGWDCMRHYEIAANTAVMAFYNLHEKPKWSAPFGLEDMKNVVAFSSAEELQEKIEWIEKSNLYETLRGNSLQWARDNTCERLAEKFLGNFPASRKARAAAAVSRA
ncbi:MAG: hypothetical protein P4L85_28555 [Paludisphaera borealis]|uniref:hypothetical protein n=1 Tax=Paludisphaera borealis TaxID=1387353 RepID=UPI00284F4E56|nr:hypothetical protein [Paludisphaera borealis]MDR3623318.1 hypothetical protein [Paludisphaera borealis]